MASYTTIEAEARSRAGKGAARATRRDGKIPAVIYGAKQPATLIALEPKAVTAQIARSGWRSRLFEIAVSGSQPARVLIRDVQLHPVTDRPEHVDFQRLAPGHRIRVAVAVHFTGEGVSPGLKRGGVLNVVRHAVECLCDPENVPAFFEADLSTLDNNDNVRWHHLKGTEGVRPVIADRDFVVATVAPPTKAAEAVADPNAPAAGAPTPAAPAAAAAKPGGKAAAAPAKAAPAKAAAPSGKAPAKK
jgi:large subunit ribosomal protein L25